MISFSHLNTVVYLWQKWATSGNQIAITEIKSNTVLSQQLLTVSSCLHDDVSASGMVHALGDRDCYLLFGELDSSTYLCFCSFSRACHKCELWSISFVQSDKKSIAEETGGQHNSDSLAVVPVDLVDLKEMFWYFGGVDKGCLISLHLMELFTHLLAFQWPTYSLRSQMSRHAKNTPPDFQVVWLSESWKCRIQTNAQTQETQKDPSAFNFFSCLMNLTHSISFCSAFK